MCSPLLLHMLCACNRTHPLWYASLLGHLLEQGLHVTVHGLCNLQSVPPTTFFLHSKGEYALNDTEVC